MIVNDWQIEKRCMDNKMIGPYNGKLTRKEEDGGTPIISWGLGSFGYDIRLSSNDFRIFNGDYKGVVDPKDFDEHVLTQAHLQSSDRGEFFILPGHSYALGVSVEKFEIPSNIVGVAVGKSTYARCGVIANITPLEPGWKGFLTLEFSNASPAPVKMYADEGCVQVLFLCGDVPRSTYDSRTGGSGKYQDQSAIVTTAKA